jgi:hypothetical protein
MNSTQVGEPGVCVALTIIFIVLKLVGVIDWAWGWVLAPLWIPIIIAVVISIVLATVTARKK